MVSRNKEQMRRFTEQQIKEVLLKENSQPRILKSVQSRGTQKGVDPRPDRPRDNPQVYDFVDTDLDERIQQQQDVKDTQTAINDGQIQGRQQAVAPLFREALAEHYPTWADTYTRRRNSAGGASSSVTTTVPSSVAFTSIPETVAEVAKITQTITKTRGRPSNASVKAKAEANIKAIAEEKAKEEARLRGSYDSATEPFSADDEGMKATTITKERATTRNHHKRD